MTEPKKYIAVHVPGFVPLINTELPQIDKDQQHNWKISRGNEHSSYKNDP